MNVYMTPARALWIVERQARMQLMGAVICGTIFMAASWMPIKWGAFLLMGWCLLVRIRVSHASQRELSHE